jgi:hypothetical protein
MKIFIFLSFLVASIQTWAEDAEILQSTWVNQAIVSTYTFNDDNIVQRHKTIAHYFSSQGWIAYLKALEQSKLLDTVKKEKFHVSAVALSPPTIQSRGTSQWQATMPLLVEYKNASMKQQQQLLVTVVYETSPSKKQWVIDSFDSVQKTNLCTCGQSQ